MTFLKRKWSDSEKWAMGLVAAAVIAGVTALIGAFSGDVVADVASRRDRHGRCVDTEVLLRNDSKADALDIEIAFDVDYFTRQGAITLEYGDERSQLIPPGQKTLIPRTTYTPVPIVLDTQASIVRVPRLQPKQTVHLFMGGETIVDSARYEGREKLIQAKDPAVMNKPRVATVTRKDGDVTIRRLGECPPP